MDWSLPSDECSDYNTATLLRITDTQDNKTLINQYISEDCLTRNGTSIGVIVHPPLIQNDNESNATVIEDQQKCPIVTKNEMEECKVYSVQIVPEYDSFLGQTQSADVIVPPKVILLNVI